MARELSRSENVNKLHRCVKSASENLTMRSGINALEDVESDLDGALKAVRALIEADRKERLVERANWAGQKMWDEK